MKTTGVASAAIVPSSASLGYPRHSCANGPYTGNCTVLREHSDVHASNNQWVQARVVRVARKGPPSEISGTLGRSHRPIALAPKEATMGGTTATTPPPFLAAMVARMTVTTTARCAWATDAPRTLGEVAQQTLAATRARQRPGGRRVRGAGRGGGTSACPALRLRPSGDRAAAASRAGDDPARPPRQHAFVLRVSPVPPGARAPGSATGRPRGPQQRRA